MTDYALAEAFVQIRPDTTGFKAEAESKIKAALAGIKPEIKIKVTPDLSGFAATVKTALAKALGGTGGTIPIKVRLDTENSDLAAQVVRLKQRMAQLGLVDFLDYNLPIGRMQYQMQLMRRLLQQAKLTDFMGTSLSADQTLAQGKALRDALDRELSGISVGVGLKPEDVAAEAAAIKAAAYAALGGLNVPVKETITGAAGAAPGETIPGIGLTGLAGQQAQADTAAASLLAMAAASTKAGDAAKYAYAANIAATMGMKDTTNAAAPLATAVNTMGYGWGFLTNRVTLFGGALGALPLIGTVAVWHILTDAIIETVAVLIPATVAFVAFGAAASPTVQHIGVQMQNVWTASNALNQSIYPLTKSMMSLGNAVKPEVYQLFGQALVVMNDKAGEFSKVAAAAGHQLDLLGARASAALVSGGFSQFLAHGPQYMAEIGDIIGNISGTIGNLLKSLPGYAGMLLHILDDVTRALENITSLPITQSAISLALWFHGAILYGGLAVTAIVLLSNALGSMAASMGIANAAALSFDSSLFIVGIKGMFTGVGELATALFTMSGAEDIAAASSDILAGAMAALDAVNPVVWVVAAAAAIGTLIYFLTRAQSATQDYDNAVKAALNNAPVSQLTINITREMADTLDRLRISQADLETIPKYINEYTTAAGKASVSGQQLNNAWVQQNAIIAGYKQELGTLKGDQQNYNELLKAAGGNMALIAAAGIQTNQIIGASSSQMAQNVIMVQAEVDQFKAMQLGVGRAGAAMNALNYTGDTTSNMLGSLDVDMQKITAGQDALTGVILGGEQAFIGFQQSVQQWGTDLGKSTDYIQNLTGSTAAALTQQSDFYSTVLPNAQKLVDSLEMQLAPTSQITDATATAAQEMLAMAGSSDTARSVIVSFINNALGPGTVSLQNLDKWTNANSVSQQGFQAIIGQSTVNAGLLGGTISQLTQTMFTNDLMMSAHVTPDLKAYSNAIINNGIYSDAAGSARDKLIKDYEATGLSAQQATTLVDGLTNGITNMPSNKTVALGVIGFGQYNAVEVVNPTVAGLLAKEAAVTRGFAGGTSGASPGWAWVGEAGPELVKFGGGEQVLPMYASGTPGAIPALIESLTGNSTESAVQLNLAQLMASSIASLTSADMSAAAASMGGAATSGIVQSWIQQAIGLAGVPANWLGALETLVAKESGGNSMAVNPIRVGGQRAEGLWQMLPTTFDAYSTGGGIFNPVSEGVAALRYIRARYGSPYNIPGLMSGSYQGYAVGTRPPAAARRYWPSSSSAAPDSWPSSRDMTAVIARLDQLNATMCATPAANARYLASTLNTASGAAITSAMYPNRGGAGR